MSAAVARALDLAPLLGGRAVSPQPRHLGELPGLLARIYPAPIAPTELVTIKLSDLRRAVGLSGARVYLALLRWERDAQGISWLSNITIGGGFEHAGISYRHGDIEPLHADMAGAPGTERLRSRQIEYGRKKLLELGLVSAAWQDDVDVSRGQIPELKRVWKRHVYGSRVIELGLGLGPVSKTEIRVPLDAARKIIAAAGPGAPRHNRGGARPGAGRPRANSVSTQPKRPPGRPRKDPADKAKRKSRAKIKIPPKLAAQIASFPVFDDAALRDLERSLRLRDDRPALTLVPKPVPTAQEGPAPIMTAKQPPKTPPILTVVTQLDARSAPEAVDQIMIRPQSKVPLRPLLLIGAGLPPQPTDVPMVRVPPPPMLSAGMSEVQQLRMMARAWSGASKARGASSKTSGVAFSFTRAPRMKGTLRKAAAALIEEQISPYFWCAWVLDMLMTAGETKEIPPVWVALSDKLIHKHAGWCCESDTASGRIVFPPAVIELQQRWRKCNDALRLVTSDAEAKATVKRLLPRAKYVELLETGRRQADMMHQDFELAATSGKWIW